MTSIVKTMAAPESGLDIRDRMWLKITIPNAFIGNCKGKRGDGEKVWKETSREKMRCSHQCHFVDCFDLIPRTHNKSVDFSMGSDIISSATWV